jgi:alpha-L-rhamnosidase
MTALAICAGLSCAKPSSDCSAQELKCEFLVKPLGIDELHPRLSWQLKDARRGAKQTAFEVQVSSSQEALSGGHADVWDSGKVNGDACRIEYAGPQLQARQRYCWRVKVWDKDGAESPYSDSSWWEMGLIDHAQWKAKWIGAPYEQAGASVSTDGVMWIWHEEKTTSKTAARSAAEGERYFRSEFDIPTSKKIAAATMWALSDNWSSIMINGVQGGYGNGWQSLNPQDITEKIHTGRNTIAVQARNSEKGPAGFAMQLAVKFEDGTATLFSTGEEWSSSEDATKDWNTTSPKSTWKKAQVLGPVGMQPWGSPEKTIAGGPASLLRKEFSTTASASRARLYVTALGSYRIHINGKRVGEDVLTPDWTDYTRRVLYQTYDVTDLLTSGSNVIAATVGDGWFASGLGWKLERFCFGGPPLRLLAQLEIQHPDGSVEVIPTDDSWKTSSSPILRSEIYAGETYDARKEQPGWMSSGFDDSKWSSVLLPETTPTLQIVGQKSQPVRVTEDVVPKSISSPSPDVYVFDMGQNMVGWARLKVSGPAGTSVRMRFAEILKPDGNIYRDNLRRAEATDTYTLKGSGEEVFEPHFTYHGFRYVEITGFPGKPTMDAIKGRVVHTDAPFSGEFSCSSELVNQIWKNTLWGEKGNLVSIPTDCPQRDERLGWMGDAQAFWLTACYNMNLSAFTEKWIQDVIEAQSEAGGFSDVSPRVIDLSDGAPAWGDAGIIVPYTAFRQYADTRLIEKAWPAMEKWLNYIGESNPNFLWEKRRNNDFGDWVPANSETDKTLIATCYWAYDAQLMAQMAHAIGRADDEKKYNELFAKIKKAFVGRFIKADGKIANGSQTCYVLAMHMNLVPDDKKDDAIRHLVDDIKSRDNHLSTGFLGTTYLMPVLTQSGHHDTAVTLLLNDTYPSWGYMVRKGATTIWERWNGDKGDPSMNSYNHYCYGAVVDWMYRYLAGIDTDVSAPGFKHIIIHPHMDERLTSATGTYHSIYGEIATSWERHGKSLQLNITIPANCTATVYVPSAKQEEVTESGKSARSAEGIHPVKSSESEAVFEVSAGTYQFTSTLGK